MPKGLKKLRRAKTNQGAVIAGVAQGIADYVGVDVILIRLIWVFLLLPGGLPGIIPYLICWLVIPIRK